MAKFAEEQTFEGAYFGRNYRKPKKDRLDEKGVRLLEAEMQPFYKAKVITWPRGTEPREERLFDEGAFMEAKGVTRGGRVLIQNYKPARYGNDGRILDSKDCDPIYFEQLREDLEQVARARRKRQYAQISAATAAQN